MATLIYVDKENGETGTRVAAKDGLKLGSGHSVKALNGRSQLSTPRFGKTFDAPPALPKATRKALGTVNRATEKSVKTNGPLNQKQPSFSAKKFESFDLPEEHQIAHLPLSGVPLMILDEERELEKLFQLGPPSPVKMPSPPWES
uniref:PTTG1 regulator of sister chromatid separation, securin n=1 Tax=Cebus imitator TaxID=2715852 RepID=A0A2K5SJC5_CEBIM